MSDNTAQSVHPEYLYNQAAWEKFRYTMEGGDAYIEQYLQKFSSREDNSDFTRRKTITTIPGFATASLIDIKNAIFQRMSDIKRLDGSDSYKSVIQGELGGVDLQGSTMNHFIGTEVLNELIFLGKVGIYSDMPSLTDTVTLKDEGEAHPYFYMYRAEQIRNWEWVPNQEGKEYSKLLLEDSHTKNNDFGLPLHETKRFRLYELQDGFVIVKFYDAGGMQIDINGEPTTEVTVLDIDRIPMVLLELERPLLQDIANHQIALMNMESADIAFTLLAGFPFYTEQKNNITGTSHLKTDEDDGDTKGADVGAVHGRSYAPSLDRPGFINPSSEPIVASMAKQQALKDDIRILVNLSVSAIQPRFASADSKSMDEKGLESGLSFLGLVLEQGERQLAKLYNGYEKSDAVTTIHYPERYSLKTDQQRLNEASDYVKNMPALPSNTYQKAIAKQVASILLEAKVSGDEMKKILQEITDAEWLTSDAEQIHADMEKGLVDTKTAAVARGYNPKKVKLAEEERAKRLAMVADAQSANVPSQARGNSDGIEDGKIEKTVSQDPDKQDDGKKAVRGKEK